MPNNDDDAPRNRPWNRGDRDDDDYDDDRPRRRRDDDDDSDRPPAKASNGLATAGLILGVLAFCTVGLTAIPGLICSAIAMGKPTGRGTAIAGLLLSIVGGLAGVGLGVYSLFASMSKVREAAARMSDSNNLKQIGLASLNYASAYDDKLPPAEDKLSWRVHILPFIEQENVYRQFNLQQPWDGPTNKPLANQRIRTYTSASDAQNVSTETRYRVFVGPGTLYDSSKKPWTIGTIPDGTSNTIYAIEAGETVPWPQPKELQYDRNGPLPALGIPNNKVIQAVMLDGSVRAIPKQTAPEVLRGGIEPNDGKLFNP